jgi:hypothetical protein
MSDPLNAAGSRRGLLILRRPAGRERQRDPARQRRRRRRRIVIGVILLCLLVPTLISYTSWMLEPTSMTFGERSTEWVRADVPFGNWLVDEAEHMYYTENAPKQGGPQLKRLPVVGLPEPRASQTPAAGAHRRSQNPQERRRAQRR